MIIVEHTPDWCCTVWAGAYSKCTLGCRITSPHEGNISDRGNVAAWLHGN